jgi:2-pyrone-4,6-dicarboxylate lactonase
MRGMSPVPAPREPSAPRRPPPAGAVDSHTHVFGPDERFPPVGPQSYPPPRAPYEAHAAMLATTSLARGVIVQPGVYSQDCSAIVDALGRSRGALRGIGVADALTADATLETWHEAGIRGLRYVEVPDPRTGGRWAGSVGLDDLERMAPRLKALGWHAQLWADCERIVAAAPMLRRLGLPVVIDHMGRLQAGKGVDDPGFQGLLGLLAEGLVRVKLSLCRVSTQRPDYEDLRPFHDALVAANPDQLLWGSDWPHVNMGEAAPDVGHLLDLFDDWIGDDALRRRILVDNPTRLFGFAPD